MKIQGDQWWSLNTEVAEFIATGLGEMIDKGSGCPVTLMDPDDNECESVEAAMEEWIKILTTMKSGFELAAKGNDVDFSDEDAKILDESLMLFAVHFRSLWD